MPNKIQDLPTIEITRAIPTPLGSLNSKSFCKTLFANYAPPWFRLGDTPVVFSQISDLRKFRRIASGGRALPPLFLRYDLVHP